jgi:hypothetical protein
MRPIQTSGSCSTLVDASESDSSKLLVVPTRTSLECRIDSSEKNWTDGTLEHTELVEQTHLYLPWQEGDGDLFYNDFSDDENECRDSSWMQKSLSSVGTSPQRRRLQLPAAVGEEIPLDKYLQTIPTVIERAEELQAQPVRILSDTTTKGSKVLNICQGEIGHVTARQVDVIVSDRATTCHIVAVRSTSGDDAGSSEPLVSLCHIDKADYEGCVRNMVETHKVHHGGLSLDPIEMDIHLVGGYDDSEGASLAITEQLLHLFGQISTEEKDDITMTLATCAVSRLNDTGFGAPIGRGLAMDVATGTVYLASVDDTVAGPAPTLRAARLYSNAARIKLSVVHTQFSREGTITVEPFEFSAFKSLDAILSLPDDIMLQYTSTSPDVEEADFCHRVRMTLRYIRNHEAEDIFGPEINQPAQFSY